MKTTIVNQNDPRVLKTKATFLKAFKELLLKYDDYMSITVKELCDKANLNRKTFYLHYKQVDELFSEIQHESIEEFFNSIKGLDIFKDVEDVIMAFFNLNEYNPVYQKICLSPHYIYTKEIGRRKAIAIFKQKKMSENSINDKSCIKDYVNAFYYYTGHLIYSKWVVGNRSIPKEEAVKIAASLIKNGISYAQNL